MRRKTQVLEPYRCRDCDATLPQLLAAVAGVANYTLEYECGECEVTLKIAVGSEPVEVFSS
jgi:hypothetical protein